MTDFEFLGRVSNFKDLADLEWTGKDKSMHLSASQTQAKVNSGKTIAQVKDAQIFLACGRLERKGSTGHYLH